jgi:hypothetical protein
MTEKKPRLVILIGSGILESIIADQELDVEVLKVDVDDESEYPVIYRLHTVEVNPKAVQECFQDAKTFWSKREKPPSGQ